MRDAWTPHYLPEGTVYGALLNFQREWALWSPKMGEAPYQAPPKAPVLYIKTANTFSTTGQNLALAPGVSEVDVGATVGLIMGAAADGVATVPVACAIFNDLCVPHDSYFRPAVKYRCHDGFLGVARDTTPIEALGGLAGLGRLQLEVRVDGVLRQTVMLADLVRDAQTLLADVNEFMSLQPGDVLLLGTDCLADGTRPRLKAGDSVEITGAGLAPLVQHMVAEEVAA